MIRRLIERFIPARAGEAEASSLQAIPYRVHPRSCGGGVGNGATDDTAAGSSPLVRGRHHNGAFKIGSEGFIPARAGEAHAHQSPPQSLQVHPRSCGGGTFQVSAAVGYHGSSPLVRGRLSRTAESMSPPGFIPARAGEAKSRGSSWCPFQVHPRSCGGGDRIGGRS